jgi:hypothetical protein
MERGKATQVMIYPRMKTKDVFVKEANAAGQRMSNWLIQAGLEKAAARRGCTVEDIIPKNEYEELQRVRGRSVNDFSKAKRLSKAIADAKRAFANLTDVLGDLSSE